MIAVDSNILVYAANIDSAWHNDARDRIEELAQNESPWAIPWPCVHEFLGIITNPRIHKIPIPMAVAIFKVERWMESPSLRVIGESAGYWPKLRTSLEAGRVVGAMVHDAKIASICLHHGVDVLWSADRDFQRFPQLKTMNPLIKR